MMKCVPILKSVSLADQIPKDTVGDAMKDKTLQPSKILSKLVALGVVFFCATFNLCILQVRNVLKSWQICFLHIQMAIFLGLFVNLYPSTQVI